MVAYWTYVMQSSDRKLKEQDIRPLITDPQPEKPFEINQDELERRREIARNSIGRIEQMKKA